MENTDIQKILSKEHFFGYVENREVEIDMNTIRRILGKNGKTNAIYIDTSSVNGDKNYQPTRIDRIQFSQREEMDSQIRLFLIDKVIAAEKNAKTLKKQKKTKKIA